MSRLRAADDFAAIRARMEELRRDGEPKTEPDDKSELSRAEAARNGAARLQLDLLRRRRRF
jgi:hypothetical protein